MGLKTVYIVPAVFFAFISPASSADIGGSYKVEGTDLDGSKYSGTADITISSDTDCRIVWHTGGQDLSGICMRGSATFAAAYAAGTNVILVRYKIEDGGTLDGVFTVANQKGVGVETLTPEQSSRNTSGHETQSGRDASGHNGTQSAEADRSKPEAAAAPWVEFRDPDGAFRVEFPKQPNIKNEGGGSENMPLVEYSLALGGRTLAVIVHDYTAKPIIDSKKVIEAVANGVSHGHEVESDTVAILDGRKGRSVTFKDEDGNLATDRIFFVRGRLYQILTVLAPRQPSIENPALEDVAHFEDSFHFTE